MSALLVLERAVDVHHLLLDAGIDNAIGGALALGFHIDDPRGTQDIDVNVFVPSTRAAEVLAVLPGEVTWDDDTVRAIERDDQVRVMWPIPGALPMPLDLFFSVEALHDAAAGRSVAVPLLGSMVRVLSATDLTIFKALFDRPKDWVDIQAMLDAHDSSVDLDEVAHRLGAIVGADDRRVQRLGGLSRS